MKVIQVILKAISDAIRPHDPTKEKRMRSFDERTTHAVTACTMLYAGLKDGSLTITESVVKVRAGWRVLKTTKYPFVCHVCKTRYPEGTTNIWIKGERGESLTYECGQCHGGPRLPGL